jgi:hypothetical protein
MFYKNHKVVGDIGQNIAIGELAKYNIGISLPISDNYPFDVILIINNNIYRAQIKTSSVITNGKIYFDFTTNNWKTGEKFFYDKSNVDICIGVCLENNKIYLFDDFEKKKNITIRIEKAKNNNEVNINNAEEYELSSKRIKELFNEEVENISNYIDHIKEQQESAKKEHICQQCNVTFYHEYNRKQFCSDECMKVEQTQRRKVKNRPSYKELLEKLDKSNFVQVGKEYKVSDNTIRKWIKAYEKEIKENILPKTNYAKLGEKLKLIENKEQAIIFQK